MIVLRRSNERGHADYGWLDTHYTFSFNTYHDPRFMGFRDLRVINEDYVAAGQGFPTHGHRDMEILTCVVEGALEHRDSTGGNGVIRPGEWQRMTAGSGVRHSEFNHSETESVHLLQIWILPEKENLTPGYEQKFFAPEEKNGKLRLVASPDGREDSLTINQNVAVYNAIVPAGETVAHRLETGRYAWLQIIKGAVDLNGNEMKAGDGAAVSEEEVLTIKADAESEILLFDLV
jgi:redox-sensitive bicupin YhaK (pirin superfamily)